MTALDEAAIRADERAKVEREIAAWLRLTTTALPPSNEIIALIDGYIESLSKAIERGKYQGGGR